MISCCDCSWRVLYCGGRGSSNGSKRMRLRQFRCPPGILTFSPLSSCLLSKLLEGSSGPNNNAKSLELVFNFVVVAGASLEHGEAR